MMYNEQWKKKSALFLGAQALSLFGSSLAQYAIIWYITLKTSSGVLMTISTLCGFVPQIMISLFAGAWIDRFDRKRLIMLADTVIAVSTLVLALLFAMGYRHMALLFVVLAIRSAGTGVQQPCVQALIPNIVPEHALMKINGINSTISSLSMFLAPALSGLLLGVAGVELSFFIDAITAFCAVSITACIRISNSKIHTTVHEKGLSVLDSIREGFRYVRRNAFVGRLLVYQTVLLILISPSAFLTPLMVSRRFGAEVWRLSVSEMVFSAGAFLGGILITTTGGFKNRIHTVLLAGICYGMCMVGFRFAAVFPVYLLCNLLIGVTMPCYNAPLTVLIQEKTDKALHGRIFSLMQISSSCALPFGMLFIGPLADIVAIEILFGIFGGLVLVWSFLFSVKTALNKNSN